MLGVLARITLIIFAVKGNIYIELKTPKYTCKNVGSRLILSKKSTPRWINYSPNAHTWLVDSHYETVKRDSSIWWLPAIWYRHGKFAIVRSPLRNYLNYETLLVDQPSVLSVISMTKRSSRFLYGTSTATRTSW